MLGEILRKDLPDIIKVLSENPEVRTLEEQEFAPISKAVYRLMHKLYPENVDYLCRLGETYHINGELRKSGIYYREVLRKCPPQTVTEEESRKIIQYAPLLYTQKTEPFLLRDVVGIHHPTKPIIAYHLFWEDDYDYPDDYEPCDHEEVWVTYDEASGEVKAIATWFHGFLHRTKKAVDVYKKNNEIQVYVEWGKHGSLLPGWEVAIDPITNIPLRHVMKMDFNSLIKGGRMTDHPIKRNWPEAFKGNYSEFISFDKPIDTKELLQEKRYMIKAAYSSPVLQQFIPYNFHPKYNWPEDMSVT